MDMGSGCDPYKLDEVTHGRIVDLVKAVNVTIHDLVLLQSNIRIFSRITIWI